MSTYQYGEPSELIETPASNVASSEVKKKPTVLSAMLNDLSKPAHLEPYTTLPVKGRPVWKVRFNNDLDIERLNKWRASAIKGKGRKATLDNLLLASYIIAGQCECLIYDGEDVVDNDDNFLTFASPDIIESLGALDVYGAIKSMYVRDSEIIKVMANILEGCGYASDEDDDYDEEGEDSDPLG